MPIGATQFWIYLTGILAAAQLGKMPPLMPVISADLGIGLVAGAVIISLLEAGGALFGSLAAAASAHLRLWRMIVGALALLVVGNLGQAAAPSAAVLTAFRALESIGYLGIVVSAPVLMAREATRWSAALSLVVWSTFLPVGLAIGAISSGALSEQFGWRTTLLVWAGLGLGLLVMKPRRDRGAAASELSDGGARWPARSAVVAALGFGCFTCFQVGMLALMPEFLIATSGASVRLAGLITGLGGLATISGVVVPFWLARRSGGVPPVLSLPLLAMSLVLPAALLLLVLGAGLSLAATTGLFIALNMLSGIFPSLVFASLPRLAGANGLGPANGVLAQAGATGSLLGPPLYASFVVLSGWTAAGAVALAVSALAVVLLLAAEREVAASAAGQPGHAGILPR